LSVNSQLNVDPIRLWSSPSSRSYQEYSRYNDYFGPFYRTSQVIATLKPEFGNLDPELYHDVNGKEILFDQVLNSSYWPELMDLQREVSEATIFCPDCADDGGPMNVTYTDVCLNPLAEKDDPTAGGCAIFSVFEYWENDWERVERIHEYYKRGNKTHSIETTYKDHFLYCTKTPSSLTDKLTSGETCMAASGSPVFPFLAVGGYENEDYSTGKALILTFMVRNFVDRNAPQFKKAEIWETAFLNILKDKEAKKSFKYWNVAFFSERSIEDVIDEASAADMIIFVISYILIFLYIMLALGKYESCKRLPIDAKISLAISGICMILLSAFAAVGVFGWAGIASNLIVMEVVPFLLLAVGADNVFILIIRLSHISPVKIISNK